MPIVNIRISAGRSREEKHGLMAGVKLGLTEALGLTGKECYIYLNEYTAENTLVPDGEDRAMTVEIFCFDGRTNGDKQALYSSITAHLEKSGQPGEQLVMVICDPVRENWGIPLLS